MNKGARSYTLISSPGNTELFLTVTIGAFLTVIGIENWIYQ